MRSILVGGLVGAVMLAGCGDNLGATTLLWYRTPCFTAPYPRMCPVERLPDGTNRIVTDDVWGYEQTWGVEADIEYQTESPSEDDSDAWTTRHVVDLVATRTVPVGTTARWYQGSRELWFTRTGAGVEVFRTTIACAPALCVQLSSTPQTNRAIDLEYTGDPAIPLRALTITTL